MKQKIDLTNPIVKLGIELINAQTEIALDTPQHIEKAIIPIYAIPKSKEHQKRKTKAEQYGSGVLLRIKDSFFILSSTHLFEAFEGYMLQTSRGNGALIEYLGGDRFSSGKIDSPYSNPLDATVFHIQSPLSDELKELALTLDDLEFNDDEDISKPIYLASGFRVKKSNTKGNSITSKREAFPSAEVNVETYKLFEIDRNSQFVMAYGDDILVDSLWRKSPSPRGFSGGAIIKIEGTNVKPPIKKPINTKQKLRAIIIEQHREKNNRPGILISTKVNVHIGLIYTFLPELFDDES